MGTVPLLAWMQNRGSVIQNLSKKRNIRRGNLEWDSLSSHSLHNSLCVLLSCGESAFIFQLSSVAAEEKFIAIKP